LSPRQGAAPAKKSEKARATEALRSATPEPQGTRDRILEAAEEEFAAHGLRGARVQEIVARAGVNQRMLYHYFGDKDGLYIAVLERFVKSLAAESEAALRAPGVSDPVERLREMLRRYFDSLSRHPNMVRLFLHEALAGWPSQRQIERIRQESDARITPLALDLFAEASRTGAFRADLDPMMALLLAGFACVMVPVSLPRLQRVFQGDLRDPKQLAALHDGLIDTLLHGVVAPGQKRRGKPGRGKP
jgi:TetR/AcrR family transcriptional regulator